MTKQNNFSISNFWKLTNRFSIILLESFFGDILEIIIFCRWKVNVFVSYVVLVLVVAILTFDFDYF